MTVWNDILSNPANLEHVLEQHASSDHAEFRHAAELIRKTGRAIFTGVGSGMNATIPASYYLMGKGFPSEYLDTTEAAYGLFPGLKGSTIILNTRSGETAELVKLAVKAREVGIPTIAVTNEPGSRVGQMADVCIPTYSRWDDLVVISAYLGMLVTELLLVGMVAENFDTMLADLQKASTRLKMFLNEVIARRVELLDTIKDGYPIYLLGRGPSLASAHGGALVIQETSRRDALAMATGLFRQGPIEAVDGKFRALVFEGKGETSQLSHRLAGEMLTKGCHLIWIGGTWLEGATNLSLPDFPAHILPLFEILPAQVLAHDLALFEHIEPGTVTNIQGIITTEEGIQGY